MKNIFLLCLLLLSGCAGIIQNPYAKSSPQELKKVDSYHLCEIMRSKYYIKTNNIYDEMRSRGYTDCTMAEVYCKEQLGLKHGTQEYANCRLTCQQQDLIAGIANQQAGLEQSRQWNQMQMQREANNQAFMQRMMPQQLNVWHMN